MQAFQTHTAAQPISIQSLQTKQKPRVIKAQHNAEKHSLFKFFLSDEFFRLQIAKKLIAY